MLRVVFIMLVFSISLFSNYINIEFFLKSNTNILIIDPNSGEIINANNKAARFYGYDIDSLKQMNINEINVFTKEQINEEMLRAEQDNRNYFIFKHKVANDKIIKVEVHSFPIIYQNKRVLLSIIHQYENKYAVEEFNRNLEEQVNIQTSQIQESKENIEKIFFVCFVLLVSWVGILIYLLKQRKKLTKKLHEDIILQKKSQAKIKEQKEEFETIFYNSNDAIAIMDLNSNFLNFNDAYIKLTGFNKQQLLEKSCLQLTIDDDVEETKAMIEKVVEKGHLENIEKTCFINNNKTLLVSMNVALMPDKKRMIVTTRDISQQKRVQIQEKLASMGEMIGNIAHQWRQPLSIITTTVSGMKLQKEAKILSDEAFDTATDSIIEQANYLSDTIDDFRTYIKNDKTKTKSYLKDILNKLSSLSQAIIKDNGIQLHLDIQEDIEVIGFKNEIVQALLNIINNAIDAIKTNTSTSDKRLIIIQAKSTKDGFELTIKDNAKGINKAIINRIFEPYFTTKHQSMGTGIGLCLAYEILTKHHEAQISVLNEKFEYENEKYKGAKFIIRFKNPSS